MLRNDLLSVGLATVYQAIYLTLLQFETPQAYGFLMLLGSPFLLCWMVYTILKYGRYNGSPLADDEFGYQDKSRDELGTF